MRTKPERAAILDVLCDDLLNWESRVLALSERTNDDVELDSYTDMGKVIGAMRGHAEVLVDYLRDKPTNFKDLIVKTEGRA